MLLATLEAPMSTFSALLALLLTTIALESVAATGARADDSQLQLNLRTRPNDLKGESPTPAIAEKKTSWDARKTAIIVIDMWDDHWCSAAARRVSEMAVPMNQLLKTARGKGVLIIHAPSSVTAFYKDTPQRKLATSAPLVPTPVPLSTVERWGTCWLYPDKAREPELPIDDSDMGCDCEKHCSIREAWTKENPLIEIADGDAITDNGQEAWNLLQARGIDNVILCGVHLNMCVLGRPVGIRQLVKLGKNVALMRDMTDTMYNHERRPYVNHFQGTDLVIEHVEKYWCPSFLSSDITGGSPFRFKEDTRQPITDGNAPASQPQSSPAAQPVTSH
jgi:nicotinamidase-related amidase